MTMTLLVDGNFMAHRAHHTTGDFSYKGKPTGVAFGVLRDIELIQRRFGATRTVWAFDAPRKTLHRRRLYSAYKANRDVVKSSEEDRLERVRFLDQLNELREDILPFLGYPNVFQLEHYEGDDIIAAVGKRVVEGDSRRFIIVSADADLFQCLSPQVSCFNPITKVYLTNDEFTDRYGIEPADWARVKAIEGCKGDNVEGLPGIGTKTAISYLKGTLGKSSKKYWLIRDSWETIERNLKLVTLPFLGIEVPRLYPDNLSSDTKTVIESRLGIRPQRVKPKPVRSGGFDV